MSNMRQVRDDEPLMIAWKAYLATDDYQNSFTWAAHEDHRNGSLWGAFSAGFNAATVSAPPVEQPAQAEAQQPGDGLVEDDLWSEEVCRLVDDAFETVSRNPSDHETAVAYRRAILAALKTRTSPDQGSDFQLEEPSNGCR